MNNSMIHGFSIDVEDWYQCLEIPVEKWSNYEARIRVNMRLILELLQKYNVKVTCFILGKIAEQEPTLIKEIHKLGHEIATHGYSHTKIYELTPERFRKEIRKSISLLEDLIGERVIGHRAAFFSITKKSLWALEILAEEGILYDSSIYPVINYRYGIPDANRLPSFISFKSGLRIFEIPVATLPLYKLNLPLGGGAYLRIYPYCFFKNCLKALEFRQENVNLYVHPWEIDLSHPVIQIPLRISATYYFNRRSTLIKLESLLSDFKFAPYREVYRNFIRFAQ